MALTYRKVKGSALTIDELDANFAYFTGSHDITGSLNVTSTISTSSLVVDYDNVGGYALRITSSGGFETSVLISNLPSTEPLVTGSLWISGSGVGSASGSGYLMVFNP
jgi:hypothetical protein